MLSIEGLVRSTLKDPKSDPGKRRFFKVVLGEFSRIDDGKPCNDEECTKALKRMIKSNLEMIELIDRGGVDQIVLEYENRLMTELMPTENIAADMDMLIAIENNIPDHISNKIRHMKPCIQYLEDKGFTVDKKRLSELLRGLN